MALYRLEAKIIGRENRGRSVVAASAYRSGGKLKDERGDKIHDYTRRGKGVVEMVILKPDNSPAWAAHPGELWNRVERVEKRKDAQLAREFILAMPEELDTKQQWQLAVGWAQQELVKRGMAAEVSLHHPKGGKNPHVHILCTLRTFEGDDLSSKKMREWNDVQLLKNWRESWATAANAALEKAGREERVDHRSLKDRGIERLPEPKIGVAATAMKSRGIDTLRHQLARAVKTMNFARPWVQAIHEQGEVRQHGLGNNWWERSLIFMANSREAVRESVLDVWKKIQNHSFDKASPPLARNHEQEPER